MPGTSRSDGRTGCRRGRGTYLYCYALTWVQFAHSVLLCAWMLGDRFFLFFRVIFCIAFILLYLLEMSSIITTSSIHGLCQGKALNCRWREFANSHARSIGDGRSLLVFSSKRNNFLYKLHFHIHLSYCTYFYRKVYLSLKSFSVEISL